MSMSAAIVELANFLQCTTRSDIRHSAIAYLAGVSLTDEGPQLFQKDNFVLGNALCTLFDLNADDRPSLLPIFINTTSKDTACASFIVERQQMITTLAQSFHQSSSTTNTFAAKLLSNLSVHFPSKVYEGIVQIWGSFIEDVIALLNESTSAEYVDYMGYVLVNCSSMPHIRKIIAANHLKSILPLITQDRNPKRRRIAVDIVRNLCFDSENHENLLDTNDELLSHLLKPLADSGDNLDTDEIDKLPLQLQYYDGERCKDPIIIERIIDALYQLCATKFGRITLRNKGVYALLREFDKATNAREEHSDDDKKKRLKVGQMIYVSDDGNTSTLHSLIGILIRDECDIQDDSDNHLSTLKDLHQ